MKKTARHYAAIGQPPVGCTVNSKCTTGNERRLSRWEHEAVLETVQARLDRNPDKMRVRRQTVEHPFGTIKSWMGIDALPHENAQARQHRDGAACLGLQHETGDAHSERWRIDGSDPDLRQAAPAILSALPNHKTRSYAAWTQ